MVGYVWLALAAVLGLLGQTVAWHTLWLGFVMAMVFGHAPIMLPALAGWRPEPTRLSHGLVRRAGGRGCRPCAGLRAVRRSDGAGGAAGAVISRAAAD